MKTAQDQQQQQKFKKLTVISGNIQSLINYYHQFTISNVFHKFCANPQM